MYKHSPSGRHRSPAKINPMKDAAKLSLIQSVSTLIVFSQLLYRRYSGTWKYSTDILAWVFFGMVVCRCIFDTILILRK